MNLQVNGEAAKLTDGRTVADLLRQMGLEGRPVAVEVNRQIVPRRDHATATLEEGDNVELVTLVGGG